MNVVSYLVVEDKDCDLEWENEKNGNVGHLVEKKALWQVSCDERTGWRGVGLVEERHKKAQKGTMWPQSGPRVTIGA